jgi:hypothetical protein
MVPRRFRTEYHAEPPTDKTIREWYKKFHAELETKIVILGIHRLQQLQPVSFCRRHLRRMCQILDWGICISQFALCVDFWGLLTKVSCTRSTVSADVPGWPVRFAAHRQPLCWNFLYHSQIVLSVGGSVWYLVQNLRCTITVDSVLANSKTDRFLIPCPRCILSRLPPSDETCKYAMAPVTQTNLERFCT